MSGLDDGFIPMHAKDIAPLAKAKEQRNQYWAALTACWKEFSAEQRHLSDPTAGPTMTYWMAEKYGIQMGVDGQGNYTDSFKVVNDNKYLLFQIKHIK